MAATYTVKSGDTLGAIASKFGTNVGSISGFRSGNPNLIFPGEVLTIGGGRAPSGGGGGGGRGIPGVVPLPKAPSFTKAASFTGAATKEAAPLFDPQIQTLKGQLPLLQKRYDLYLEQLTTAGERRQGELETKQIADVSRTGAAASTRGLRGGLVEAQVRGVETTFEKLINTLTVDISSQKKELGISREDKDLELRGLISSLVGQKASKIMELSRALSNSENERRVAAFNNLLKISTASFERFSTRQSLALSRQELQISKQRLANEQSAIARALKQENIDKKDQKQVLSFTSRLNNILTAQNVKAKDLKSVGRSFFGQQSKRFPGLSGYFTDVYQLWLGNFGSGGKGSPV